MFSVEAQERSGLLVQAQVIVAIPALPSFLERDMLFDGVDIESALAQIGHILVGNCRAVFRATASGVVPGVSKNPGREPDDEGGANEYEEN
jgi:hypothetical protein